jgi:hypothetical protein
MNSEVEVVPVVNRTISTGAVVVVDFLPDFRGTSDEQGLIFSTQRIRCEPPQTPISVIESRLVPRPRRSAVLQGLRRGLEQFLLAAVIGVSLVVVSKGLALAFLYGGLLALLITTYRHGLRTGDYLVSPRYTILGMLALAGLTITALIATVEGFVQRGP